MDIFLARQPIFDRDLQVLAYELLYRSDAKAIKSEFQDGNRATSQVIAQSVLVTNFERLVSNKRAFIHFTPELILEEIPLLFDKGRIVIELSAIQTPDEKLLGALALLKSRGYTIALNDALADGASGAMLALADILKVDIQRSGAAVVGALAQQFKQTKVKLLAEKVETRQDFHEALTLGCAYFQGYFFAKPDTVKSKDIHPLSATYPRLLKLLSNPETSYDQLAAVIESDVALSFKLLKLINSAAFYRRSRIQSIQQALVLLGLKELRKWVMILMLQDAAQDKPDELLTTVLIRGRMMELIAKRNKLGSIETECFLTGTLSLIDVMTDQDMPMVIQELSLSEGMSRALVLKEGLLGALLGLVVSYEQTEQEDMQRYCKELTFDMFTLPMLYFEAMEWVDLLLADQTPIH